MRIKKKSHKIPNLDGTVKSGRKEWNEANLWSLSKFLFLLPTGFISIHMLPMWSLEPQTEAAELWIILAQNIQVEYRNKISESYALSPHQNKEFKSNVLLPLPWVLCVHYPEFSVSIVQGSEKLGVATSVKVLLFRIGEKEDSMVCVVMWLESYRT